MVQDSIRPDIALLPGEAKKQLAGYRSVCKRPAFGIAPGPALALMGPGANTDFCNA